LATGRCTSQQLTEQNTSPVRLRLHVETLQIQKAEPKGIGFLHALHRRHWLPSTIEIPPDRDDSEEVRAEVSGPGAWGLPGQGVRQAAGDLRVARPEVQEDFQQTDTSNRGWGGFGA
jgi:hypothetical protein